VILVDSSVWVAVFRRDRPLDLTALVAFDDVVTCLPIVQEVLQGFREESAFRKAKQAMLSLPMVDSPLDAGLFENAIDLYRGARRAGLTIRSSVDCLIAASAIRHGLQVLHRDRDFTSLAKVAPLQQRSI
jgi:predicted nucleic acid-binding protein